MNRMVFGLVGALGVAVAVASSMACNGGSLNDETDAGAADAGDPHAAAEALFRKLEPALTESCGGAGGVCHVDGSGGAPAWMKSPDAYVSIRAYDNAQSGGQRFVTEVANESRLFTKGKHSGPELLTTTPLGKEITAWIQSEIASSKAAKAQKPSTAPVSVSDGTQVTIDLSRLGSGMKGATITFDASLVGEILTLSNMTVAAPASNGMRVTHPLFIQFTGNVGTPDPGDSCGNVDTKVKEGGKATLGPGTLVLTQWKANSKLGITFDYVGPYQVVDGVTLDGGTKPGQSGCKNVPGFQAIASNFSDLSRNCVGCHAGGNAQNALDMSELARANPDYAAACAAALFQVGLTDKARSPIILAPTSPMLAHAGGKLTAAEQQPYTDAIMSWLAGE
ncbi:MAG: hypothetical protein U0169_03530 [Polyangiaceae bacterium]